VTLYQYSLAFAVLLPALACGVLGGLWWCGARIPERLIAKFAYVTYVLMFAAVLVTWFGFAFVSHHPVTVPVGMWYHTRDFHFEMKLQADGISLPFLGMTALLVGVISAFSERYMHRDPGFVRFYFLLHLFALGCMLLYSAGTFDLLAAGWELLGLTSVLLIAYFQHRTDPVNASLRVFATYRITDIGLLTALGTMHHAVHSTEFDQVMPGGIAAVSGPQATVVLLLLMFAACGKSAQLPFSGWLPRAMEGPTPTSAIFYGALSVHAGVYLILRVFPLIEASVIARGVIVAIGALTAIYGTVIGRATSDVKSSIAHASMTQLGLMFMELGFGWTTLALWHACGHAAVRTLEFLRAPSALRDTRHIHSGAMGQLDATGQLYEKLLPVAFRTTLYRLAVERCYLDNIIDRFVHQPFLWLITTIVRIDHALIGDPRDSTG